VQRLARAGALTTALDGSLAARLSVALGEPFQVETEDASCGVLTSGGVIPDPATAPYLRHSPPQANPLTGPVAIDGVHAGDTLEIDVLDIELDPTGVTFGRAGTSPMADSVRWCHLAEPFADPVTHRDGDVLVGRRLRWRQAPMIGTIACAPEWEVRSTWAGQDDWGGNLDISDVAPGSTLYLRCYHDQGRVFVGDVHGCQGDGEYSGVADESRAVVTLRVNASVATADLPVPRIVTPRRWVAIGIARPLERAVDLAIRRLMRWLVVAGRLSDVEAYRAVSLHPDFTIRVYQMTAISTLQFVAGASLPRELFEPSGEGSR
jgi:amidase